MTGINDLIGKPFVDCGRGPHGYDCWGLVREIYRRHGVEIPDYSISAESCAEITGAVQDGMQSGAWLELHQPETPCLVVIRIHPNFSVHLGVYVGYGRFLHVKNAVVIDKVSDPVWIRRIHGYWRYVG